MPEKQIQCDFTSTEMYIAQVQRNVLQIKNVYLASLKLDPTRAKKVFLRRVNNQKIYHVTVGTNFPLLFVKIFHTKAGTRPGPK